MKLQAPFTPFSFINNLRLFPTLILSSFELGCFSSKIDHVAGFSRSSEDEKVELILSSSSCSRYLLLSLYTVFFKEKQQHHCISLNGYALMAPAAGCWRISKPKTTAIRTLLVFLKFSRKNYAIFRTHVILFQWNKKFFNYIFCFFVRTTSIVRFW